MQPTSLTTGPLTRFHIVVTRLSAAALAIAAIWALVGFDLRQDRALIERETLVKVQGNAIDFAENLQKSVQQIDQMSLTLVKLHEAGASHAMLHSAYTDILEGLPLYPIFFDEKGIARYTRTPLRFTLDLSQHELFLFHRSSNSRELRINPREAGVGMFLRQDIVRLSRRVNKPDGSFGGVVAITMLPRYMNAFNDASTLGDADFASVWLTDGQMLTNHTRGWGDRIFQHYKSAPPFPGELGARRDPDDKFHDNGAHYVGWRRLNSYPLIALVAYTEDNVMRPLRANELTHFAAGALASLLVLLLAWTSARTAMRRSDAHQKILRAQARYRHAVDSVREAVLVVNPAPHTGRVTEFIVEDCNAPALRLVPGARDGAIGRSVGELFSMNDAFRLREVLLDALKSGSAQREMRSERHEQPVWFFVHAVKIDDSIALTMRDITDLKTREQQVQTMALTDPLTMLHNRIWLDQHLQNAVPLARRESGRLSLLVLNFDHFKLINDTLGHKTGDELLVTVAITLSRSLRSGDHVARISGHGFAVLLAGRDESALETAVQQMRGALRDAQWPVQGDEMAQRLSIGVASFPEDADDADGLLKAAELAVGAASQAGGGMTCRFERSMRRERENRLWLEQALPAAIRNDELRLYLQPRVSARSGRLASFEALVRWQHPERGLLLPAQFIPVAEETGAIVPLGAWMLRATFRQLAQWRDAGLPLVPVSVNVSAQQLADDACRTLIRDSLAEFRLPASLLAVELTESMMVGDNAQMLGELKKLRAMGVELHIDDFGTGYSSLAQLQRIDIDALKVDQSFVSALGVQGQARQLCEAVVSIGKSLGATVVAEGVETIDQFNALRAMGCDEIQGYLASRPVPSAQAEAMLGKPELVRIAERLPAAA